MKPTHIRAGIYAMYFEQLKDIAKEYGYNLVLHGSMNRDLDLIAIPWVDDPQPEQHMVAEFHKYMTGKIEADPKGHIAFTVLPGNRHSYVIILNRGDRHGEWVRFADEQYYLDLSITQITKT